MTLLKTPSATTVYSYSYMPLCHHTLDVGLEKGYKLALVGVGLPHFLGGSLGYRFLDLESPDSVGEFLFDFPRHLWSLEVVN